jgi:hypothetical protein
LAFFAFLFGDSSIGLSFLTDLGSFAGALIPDHFDVIDCAFAFITVFLIIKFVNSLRPILGE